MSAFDANKKVLYFALNGQLVFRAFIRLTKGTLSNRKSQNNHLQFVDITKEEQESASKQIDQTEQLTLFLERPYFKGISEEKERERKEKDFCENVTYNSCKEFSSGTS